MAPYLERTCKVSHFVIMYISYMEGVTYFSITLSRKGVNVRDSKNNIKETSTETYTLI